MADFLVDEREKELESEDAMNVADEDQLEASMAIK